LKRSEQGSILMELVIVIPIYLVIIGGTMWLGDLILAKQKLVIADRYAAWNAGNRHRADGGGIRGEIQDNMFDPTRVGDQVVEDILYEAGPLDVYQTPVGATVPLTLTMPVWSRGWLSAGVSWGGYGIPDQSPTFKGRDDEVVADPSHHVVFMRTMYGTYAYRTWEPIELADVSRPWQHDVYNQDWTTVGDLSPTSIGSIKSPPGAPSPPSGYEHERHDAFEDWSI